jgi:hypothetical protein
MDKPREWNEERSGRVILGQNAMVEQLREEYAEELRAQREESRRQMSPRAVVAYVRRLAFRLVEIDSEDTRAALETAEDLLANGLQIVRFALYTLGDDDAAA